MPALIGLLISPIISAMVPVLVNKAEALFPTPPDGQGQGAAKYAWVQGAVSELLDAIVKKFGLTESWAQQLEGGIEVVLKDAIEAAVSKIDP